MAPQSVLNQTTNEDVAILVPSFDGYRDLWKPFFACFFKYWPDCPYPVFLGSNFQTYDNHRVTPIQIGPDRDYSSNLIVMLSLLPYEWVVVILEDMLFCEPVKTNKLRDLISAGQQINAGLVQLLSGRFNPNVAFASVPISEELSEMPVGLPYRVSMTLGLWRKSVLLNLLRPGESAWAFEYQGSKRTSAVKDRFFCLSRRRISDPVFRCINGVIKGEWTFLAYKLLQREGLCECIKGRPVQSFAFQIYLHTYIILRHIAFWITYRCFGSAGMSWLVSKQAATYDK